MYYSCVNLTKYNTLAVPAVARWFLTVDSLIKLKEGVEFGQEKELEISCLGMGSNIVFKKDLPGLILHNTLLGKEITDEDEDSATVEVWSGENWHQLVKWTIQNNLYGLENLALIPGTTGAAPIQNIGAYGVELSSFVDSVEFFDFKTKTIKRFSCEECRFGYRNSIFKQSMLNKIFITKVILKLNKKPSNLKYEYEPLKNYMQHHRLEVTPKSIYQAVCAIRKLKLPDIERFPNAGSFFKNPIVATKQLENLKKVLPDVKYFDNDENSFKVSGGFLIEKAGWKGYRKNGIGIHYNQALVLTNVRLAKGTEILDFAQTIIDSVKNKFGISLEIEPQIYPRFNYENKPLPVAESID